MAVELLSGKNRARKNEKILANWNSEPENRGPSPSLPCPSPTEAIASIKLYILGGGERKKPGKDKVQEGVFEERCQDRLQSSHNLRVL